MKFTFNGDLWKSDVLQGGDHGLETTVQNVAVKVQAHQIHVQRPDQLPLLDHQTLQTQELGVVQDLVDEIGGVLGPFRGWAGLELGVAERGQVHIGNQEP